MNLEKLLNEIRRTNPEMGIAVLKGLIEKCDKGEIPVEKQIADLKTDFAGLEYGTDFKVGDLVMKNKDADNYKFPNETIPGLVIHVYQGADRFIQTKNGHGDVLNFEDLLIAVKPSDTILYFRVNSRWMVSFKQEVKNETKG